MLCVPSTQFSRWDSGIDTASHLKWSLNGIASGGVVCCGQISLGRFDCGLMDSGVGLRIMWGSGENRGCRNPLQYREVYDTIAAWYLKPSFFRKTRFLCTVS